MKQSISWLLTGIACLLSLLIGAMIGVWLFFKVYGGADERLVSGFLDQARVIELASRDGLSAQSELMRDVLPRVQASTADLAFISAGSLDPAFTRSMREALQKLGANPLVQDDQGEWSVAAKAARECILLMPAERNDWMSCRRPVKAVWPRKGPAKPD
ncbi:hypothetical protein [Dokdonella sp.]|uniref:hypothetical protein n=1 Tax=Dokdonella sp. TaxID=2291710 RepID=UPI0025C6EDEA|nr:hypothetical protein [Dokdonella sp.]MBX3688872.1 hypothetical protein [Dokdonella sp.]